MLAVHPMQRVVPQPSTLKDRVAPIVEQLETDMTSDLASELQARHTASVHIVEQAAEKAWSLFKDKDALNIEVKGLQDWVSNADKSVEDQIRAELSQAFPNDGIVGEEHGNVVGTSGYTWVIDPIDGTSNFVTGTPGWCVVLACVLDGQTVSAAICDPIAGETFTAVKGQGARLNGKAIQCSPVTAIDQGTLGLGHSTRVPADSTVNLLTALLNADGLFRRSGSGALDLAYVSAGRLIGFVEPHMNAWDCIAALLLIEEAGGQYEAYDMDTMLAKGGRVITACAGVYDEIHAMTDKAYR